MRHEITVKDVPRRPPGCVRDVIPTDGLGEQLCGEVFAYLGHWWGIHRADDCQSEEASRA